MNALQSAEEYLEKSVEPVSENKGDGEEDFVALETSHAALGERAGVPVAL